MLGNTESEYKINAVKLGDCCLAQKEVLYFMCLNKNRVNLDTLSIQVLDKSLQKKCYRLLEDICACKSTESREFVQEHLSTIQETLLKSLSSSSPSSKAVSFMHLVY